MGTKIRKKMILFCNFQKSIYLCTRLTAIRSESLAQQVEHNTFNVGVLGSSPKRITRRSGSYIKVILWLYVYYASLPAPCKHVDVNWGSAEISGW